MKKIIVILSLTALLTANVLAEPVVKTVASPVVAEKKQPVVKAFDLKTLYKREFAFLQSQKGELSKRLSEFNGKSIHVEAKLRAKISGLERATVRQSGELQDLESLLSASEYAEAAMEERSEVLSMTYQQAKSSLKNYGIDLSSEPSFQAGSDEIKLDKIFSDAAKLLSKLSSISKKEGQFYLQDGKQAKGQIIQLGNIASYGVSDAGSGALVPAGGQQMKVWGIPAVEVAKAFAEGVYPKQLKIFLYESRDKAIEEREEKTWLSVIRSGGIIGWVIVGLGVVALILVLLRSALLKMNSSSSHQIEEQVVKLVSAGKLADALQACYQCKGAIARVLSSTLRHVKDDRDHMEDIITEAILHESGMINKFSSTILVIASVSPLLGLLGTVTGMISTFDIITEFGTGDPKLLSSGISIALVTTELGLIVAIPTLLMGTLLNNWGEGIKMEMEKVALSITNIVLNEPDTTHLESFSNLRNAA